MARGLNYWVGMTRMIQTHHARLDAMPRTMGGRISRAGRSLRRIVGTAGATAELFPPVMLVGGLALYFYILACIGGGGEGTAP